MSVHPPEIDLIPRMNATTSGHCHFGLPLSEVKSAPVQRFHACWQALKHADHLPSRASIDPADIKPLLPYILLVDIEREPFRVKYRICGTRVAEICGDVTGKYLDELNGGSVWSPAEFQRQYEAVCNGRLPIFGRQLVLSRYDSSYPCFIGIWPLSRTGQDVDMCIAIEDYLELRPEQLVRGARAVPATALDSYPKSRASVGPLVGNY